MSAAAIGLVLAGAAALGFGVEEKLGAPVPRDLAFTDSAGREVRLGALFEEGKPVVLALAYERCPMLCGLVLGGAADAFRASGLALGEEFRAITVSIDPREAPAQARLVQGRALARAGIAGPHDDAALPAWPFLVGREPAIRALADAVGFRYRLDRDSGEYEHAAVIVVLTPAGTVSRYLYGVELRPRDLRFALVEASAGRAGTTLDRVLLRCFRWDPAARRYHFAIFAFLRAGSAVLLAVAGFGLWRLWRKEHKEGAATT